MEKQSYQEASDRVQWGRYEAPRRKRGALWFVLGALAGAGGAVIAGGAVMAWGSGLFPAGKGADGAGGTVITSQTTEKIRALESYIDQFYLESDSITQQQKADGLYKGLFQSLGDPYSVYYTAEEMAQIEEDTEGVYYGIGAYIGTDEVTGAPMITGVIKASPAESGGLMDGDLLYKVDDEDVSSLSLDEIVRRIRGPEGTVVHLSLYRDGELVEVDLTRAQVNSPTVESEVLEDGIGYLQITEFDNVTVGQFEENMQSLREQGIKGLVLDLRNNPGGNVSAVTKIAGEILPKGLVFYMEDKAGSRTEYTCDGADFDLPLVVLVNGNSASAAEILSGAVQDAGIGKLVGTQTFGKGVVQNLIPLSDGTDFKLTVAGYFTRGGKDINKVGIKPDVEVELDIDKYREDKTDTQLDKALEVLREEMK